MIVTEDASKKLNLFLTWDNPQCFLTYCIKNLKLFYLVTHILSSYYEEKHYPRQMHKFTDKSLKKFSTWNELYQVVWVSILTKVPNISTLVPVLITEFHIPHTKISFPQYQTLTWNLPITMENIISSSHFLPLP